jgi:hypothetical protein
MADRQYLRLHVQHMPVQMTLPFGFLFMHTCSSVVESSNCVAPLVQKMEAASGIVNTLKPRSSRNADNRAKHVVFPAGAGILRLEQKNIPYGNYMICYQWTP